MIKHKVKLFLVGMFVMNSMFFVLPVQAAVSSASYESSVKNFPGIDAPGYGNIGWNFKNIINGNLIGESMGAGLSSPTSVAVDSNGLVYAFDGGTLKTYTGGVWSSFASQPTVSATVNDFDIDLQGNIYVIDTTAQLIRKYTKSSNSWSNVNSTTPFNFPRSVAVDSAGNIFVIENSIIQKFDFQAGTWSTFVAATGAGANYYNGTYRQSNIAVDASDNVYWADNAGVHKKTPAGVASMLGTISTTFGGQIAVDRYGNVYLNNAGSALKMWNGSSWVQVAPTGTTTLGSVTDPYSIAVDKNDNVYVVMLSATYKIQKLVPGTSIKMRVRTSANADMSGASGWDDACNVLNGSDISDTGTQGDSASCVHDGDKYVQYQATLNTDSGVNTIALKDVNISTQATYLPGWLVSVPFNSTNQYNTVQKIAWTADTTQGSVKFQVRTAPDNGSGQPDWTNSVWCGPSSCSATPNSTASFANSYYTNSNGSDVINTTNNTAALQKSKFFQYASFLNPSADSMAAPTLQQVQVNYAFNTPPQVSIQETISQVANGTVPVTYRAYEIDADKDVANGNQQSAYATIFYQPDNTKKVQLNNSINDTATSITLYNSDPTNIPIPTSGTNAILIDSELITYTGVTNPTSNNPILTGVTRHANFGSNASFPTQATSHNGRVEVPGAPAEVWFLGKNIGTVDSSSNLDKTTTWTPKTDSPGIDNGKKFLNLTLKVVASDGSTFGSIGNASQNLVLDLEKPYVNSVTTDPTHTSINPILYYNKDSAQIPIQINFSENINFDSVGGTKEIKITLNSGICKITSDINSSNNAVCQYAIGVNEATPIGNKLNVNSISTTGVIKDDLGNVIGDLNPITNLNASTNVIIDNTPPVADSLADIITKQSFSRTLNNVSDENSGIAVYAWSKVSGTGSITFGSANAASTTISASQDGTYVIKAVVTDKAGNATERTFTLIWDTTNPGQAGKPSVPSLTKINNPTISWPKATDSLSGLAKYEVQRKVGAGGSFATVHTITDSTTLSAETPSFTESSALPDDTYYYQVITTDKAGNTSTSVSSDSMRVDTTKPSLQYIDSTTPGNNASTAYGTSDSAIDIRAVYSEPVAKNSTIKVHLNLAANIDVILTQNVDGYSNVLTGSFAIQGPYLGYDTDDLRVQNVVAGFENVTDEATNVQNNSTLPDIPQNFWNTKTIFISTGPPILQSFSAQAGSYTFNTNGTNKKDIKITASYSKPIQANGAISVKLNANVNGPVIVLNNTSEPYKAYGTYTVQAGDNVDNLQVVSIESQDIRDSKGNTLSQAGTMTQYDAFFAANGVSTPVSNLSGVKVDTTNPVITTIEDVDAGPVQSDTVKIHVDESNPVDYKYIFSVDNNCSAKDYSAGTVFASDESLPFNTQDNNGKYICAQVDDQSGNKVYWASSTVFNIDVTKPTGAIKVDGSTNSGQLQFSATDTGRTVDGLQVQIVVNDDVNASCDFSSASWEPYTGSKNLSDITSDIKVCVQYKDVAGNISDLITATTPETPINITVSDTSNLSATPVIRRGLISWQAPSQLGLGWKNAEVDSCNVPEADVDCDPTDPIASPSSIVTNQQENFYVHSNLQAGKKYCYRVKFSDTNDDVSLYSDRKCFIPGADMTPADVTAPVVANVLPSNGNYIKDGHVDFTLSEALQPGAKIVFTSTTAVNSEVIDATHEYSLVDSELSTTDPQTKTVGGLIDGNTYKLKFTGSDLAGNPINFTEVTNIHFDSTAPNVNDVTPANNAVINNAAVTFTLSEQLHEGAKIVFINVGTGAVHEYVLSGPELVTISPQTKTVQGLVGGNTYSLKFEGSDLAWNFMTFSEITGINFDSNAPTISESLNVSANEFSPNGDGVKDTINFSFKSNKSGTYSIALSGSGKTATLAGTMDADTLKSHNWDGKNALSEIFSDGNVSATLSITDVAGNSTTGNPIIFKVDTTAPAGTFSINSNAQITISPNVTLSSAITDSGSGLSTMSFSDDNVNWSSPEAYGATKSWTLPGEDGEKTVYAKYEDNAGNTYLLDDTINLNTNSLSISFVGADGDVNQALNNSDHISIRIDGINIANAAYGYTSETCDAGVDGDITNQITGTATSRTKIFDVTDQSVNGKYLCIRADDGGSTVEYKKSAYAFNIDSTKPLISFVDNVDGNLARSEDVIIHAEDANLDVTSYAFTNSACDASQDFSNTFVSDVKFTIDTEHAGQYICAKALDRAGNVEFVRSANTLNIDATAPVGTVSIDRATTEGKVSVVLKPVDLGGLTGMRASVQLLESNSACNFSSPVEVEITGETTTGIFDDSASSIKKVCVKFTDGQGNVSEVASALTPETPQAVSIRDISNISASPQFRGAMISWQAPVIQGSGTLKNAEVDFCKGAVGDADCVATQPVAVPSSIITNSSQTYYVHNDLDDAKYCYRVKFQDTFDNRSAYSESKCFVPGTGDVVETQASIQDVSIDNITKTEARISFRTVDTATGSSGLPTKTYVEAFDNSDFSGDAKTATSMESAFSVDHIIKLTVPTSLNPYYLRITVLDSTGKTTVTSYDQVANPELTFTTLGILTKINIDLSKQPRVISDTAAVVEFATDQRAVCFIENGTTTGTYTGSPTEPEEVFVQSHAIIHIEGLLPLTNYFFRVTCSGDEGTTISSSEGSFKTLEKNKVGEVGDGTDKSAPEISNVALANITGENATITWNTQEVASSSLAYEVEGTDFMLMSGDYAVNADVSKYSTTHTVQLKGLLPASKYSFTVLSTDASGNIGQSSLSTFTTKEPSSISSIKVISKALGQATITWETGAATSSLVEYGLTTAYGQKKEDSSKTKEHSITLSDLTPGETYHFRVKGDDVDKNIFASSDITFQTKAPPKISDFKVDSISEHSAVITFNTNVSTDAIVNFENTDKPEDTGFQGRPDFVSKHEIKLKDLTSGSTFSVKLKVRDEDGNETQETFPNFTTTKDEVPPKIDRVKTDSALTQNDKVQAIISWSTDELSTGEILYKEGRTGDDKKFDVNSAPSLSHIGVITSFKSGVVYYFKVRSTDSAGNTVTSSDYALLTPKQRQNIIQVIIGNFTDIFGWAKF